MRVSDPQTSLTAPPPDAVTPDFELRVARALSLLSAANLRLSVFAVRMRGGDGPALSGRLQTVLGRSHEVACVDGDTVGILYYGPRPRGPGSDRRVEEDLRARLAAALEGATPDHLFLQALHVSSAHMVEAGDLIRNLRCAPRLPAMPSIRPLAA